MFDGITYKTHRFGIIFEFTSQYVSNDMNFSFLCTQTVDVCCARKLDIWDDKNHKQNSNISSIKINTVICA